MSVSNAKSDGLLIQLTSLMWIMLVPCVQYVCNPNDTYYFYKTAQPFTQMQCPQDNTSSSIHKQIHICKCNMKVTELI